MRIACLQTLALYSLVCFNSRPQSAVTTALAVAPRGTIQNLEARYDHATDSIFVHWAYPKHSSETGFEVRYRITNRQAKEYTWKHVRADINETQLEFDEVRNGDELQVQVRSDASASAWSQSLLIAISKRLLIDGVVMDDNDLLPPFNFATIILSASLLRLEWTPISTMNKELFYIVNVKQLTGDDSTPLLRQQIKTEANNLVLGDLAGGHRYEMTIRSALGLDRISATAAIVEITMPREDEYFEVGNLLVSSHFLNNGQGVVNLTWETPPNMQHKIKGYEVEYAFENDTNWHKFNLVGHTPHASLTDLRANTQYKLKIRTFLDKNLATESGQFKFKTPFVAQNPIGRVDVIYTHDVSTVRLQWLLESFVAPPNIAGYELLFTDDRNLPEVEWKRQVIIGSNPAATLNNLQAATVYYVRINVRKLDKQTIRASSIYRFQTMGPVFLEHGERSNLSYRNFGGGKVYISWNYPSQIASFVTGASLFYTNDNSISVEEWNRIDINNPQQKSLILHGLRRFSNYYVRIVPQLNHSYYDKDAIDMFVIKTTGFDRLV